MHAPASQRHMVRVLQGTWRAGGLPLCDRVEGSALWFPYSYTSAIWFCTVLYDTNAWYATLSTNAGFTQRKGDVPPGMNPSAKFPVQCRTRFMASPVQNSMFIHFGGLCDHLVGCVAVWSIDGGRWGGVVRGKEAFSTATPTHMRAHTCVPSQRVSRTASVRWQKPLTSSWMLFPS